MTRRTWWQSVSLFLGIALALSPLEFAAAKDKGKGASHGGSAFQSHGGSPRSFSGSGHSRNNFSGRTGNSGTTRSFDSWSSGSRGVEPRIAQPRNMQPRSFDQNNRFPSGDGQPRRVDTFRPPTDNINRKVPSGKLIDGDLPGNRSGSPKYPKYNSKNQGTLDSQFRKQENLGRERPSPSRHPKADGPNLEGPQLERPNLDRPKFDRPKFDQHTKGQDSGSGVGQPGQGSHDHSGPGKYSRDHHPDRLDQPGKFDRLPQGTRDALNKGHFPHDLKLGPGAPATGGHQNKGLGSNKLDYRHRDPSDFDRDRMSGDHHNHGPNFTGNQVKRDRYDMQHHRINHEGKGSDHPLDAATMAKWSKQSWREKSNHTHYDNMIKNTAFQPYHLDRQYALHNHGDIARQLNLRQSFINQGGWQHRHVGVVSSQFRNQCSFRNYWGPSWFPQRCWYPRWSPWVSWSWGFQCNPWFDPRPIYCRPMIYAPCARWSFWQYPVWQPLPVVAAGTWVNVPQVMVDEGFDARLLAVRFVDPGQPDQNLGQRYRVWIRNDSNRDIDRPFNVVLMGTNDLIPGDQRLEVGQRVPKLAAGQTLAIDLRLPLSPEGMDKPMPFEKLHVLVDANRELNDVEMTNNGAVLDRGDILPVDPAAFNVDADVTTTGQVITIAGEGLGPGPGQVLLQVGNETYQPEILGWYDLGVQVRVPVVAADGMAEGDLVVIRGDGAAANPLAIQIAGAAGGREF